MKQSANSQPRGAYLSAKDVARELGIGRSSAYRIMREMPHLEHGKILRVTAVAFAQWCERQTRPPVEPWRPLPVPHVRVPARSRVQSDSLIRPIVPRTKPRSAAPDTLIRHTLPRTKPRTSGG